MKQFLNILSKNIYFISVTLKGKAGNMFRGFQMRALQVGGNPEAFFGNFTEVPANTMTFLFHPKQSFPWTWVNILCNMLH